MTGSCNITRRATSKGEPRYVVRYRLGGRAYKLQHGGSFRTLKEARARRDWIAGEIAAGRIPDLRVFEPARRRKTLGEWADAWFETRVDLAEKSTVTYRDRVKRLKADLGDKDPLLIEPTDVQEWIAACGMQPTSIAAYVSTLKMILDFAGVEPNPARDRRVKLPRIDREIPSPPSSAQVQAILENLRENLRLPVRVLEQTGMRVGELCALEWRDVDVVGSRFRVREGKSRAARRWVLVPEREMRAVDALTSFDDRLPERRVFGDLTESALRAAMGRACRHAKIPEFSPHDLRHRYASLQIKRGVPVTDLSAQLGHARKAMTLDVYAHVMVEDDDG